MSAWRRFKRESKALRAAYAYACSRPVSVFAFGAKGDWFTDDAVAIQKTIDFLVKYGGGGVLVHGHRIGGSLSLAGAHDVIVIGNRFTSPAPAMREEEGP